jgi:NAD+ kinase
MRIIIFANANKDPGGKVTAEAEAILRQAGLDCVLFSGDLGVFEGAYAAVSVGGDGTFLRCAKYAVPRGVAILGIHLGHTGYLARVRPDDLAGLKNIMSFAVKERSVLESDGCIAVNDFTFTRGMDVQTVSLELEADGRPLGSFLGDGVIISSSTGSTGYAMSAGGPVVDPSVSAIMVTPVCAHTSRSHTFVLAPERVLSVRPSQTERRPVFISADGDAPRLLGTDECITIRISKLPLKCLEPDEHDFFDNVRIHRL